MSNRVATLQKRIRAIRLSGKALSSATGLDEDTISRTFKGKTDPLTSTLDLIENAVVAEEARLTEHLAKVGEHAA